MAEKVTGLRFEVIAPCTLDTDEGNECQRRDVKRFLSKLKTNIESQRPKFKIAKVAIDKQWGILPRFTCLTKSEGRPTINPVLELEFDGFRLSSTKNAKKVKFGHALGKDTLVYKWDKNSESFINIGKSKSESVPLNPLDQLVLGWLQKELRRQEEDLNKKHALQREELLNKLEKEKEETNQKFEMLLTTLAPILNKLNTRNFK